MNDSRYMSRTWFEKLAEWLTQTENIGWEDAPEDLTAAQAEAARLRGELAAAVGELGGLKQEVDSLRLVLSEQNVLTSSALSSLKEMKQELEESKAASQGLEEALRETDMEVERLQAELMIEKRRAADLAKLLARETSLRSKLEHSLAGQEESRAQETPEEKPQQRYYLHYIPKNLAFRYRRAT